MVPYEILNIDVTSNVSVINYYLVYFYDSDVSHCSEISC